jgi:hypothetical protein
VSAAADTTLCLLQCVGLPRASATGHFFCQGFFHFFPAFPALILPSLPSPKTGGIPDSLPTPTFGTF